MQQRATTTAALLFGLALSTGAAAQTLTISGPGTGPTDTLLQFEAIATGCSPIEGQYFWQVDGGLIAGIATNRVIHVSWSTSGTKSINVFHPDCSGAFAEAEVVITAPGRITLGANVFVANEGDGQVQVSVLRQGGSEGAVSVEYSTSDGSALQGSDYEPASGTLSWADGDASNRLIPIAVLGDALFEEDESFFVALSNASGAALSGIVEARIDIIDNDPPPGDVVEFSQVLFSAPEAAGDAVVTLTRSGTSAGAISVVVNSINNTAVAPDDFEAVATTVDWPAGDTSDKVILVPIIDDDLEEGTEIADLVLSNPQPDGGVFLGNNSLAQLIIIDDDVSAGSISFFSVTVEATEDQGSTSVTVERIGGTEGAVQVALTVTGGSATVSEDFNLPTNSVSFADGDGEAKVVDIPIVDDDDLEGTETIEIALSVTSGSAVVGVPHVVTIRIEDDDIGAPDTVQFSGALAGGTATIDEDAGTTQYSVTRVGNFFGTAAVTVLVESGSAEVGSDVQPLNQTLQWANGEGGAKSFGITVVDDDLTEATETFQIRLTSPEGATLGLPNTVSVSIVDNDAGSIGFATTFLALAEPGDSGVLVIERSGPSDLPASADIDVAGSAELGVDYSLSATSVDWTAGDSSPRELVVNVLDDAESDPGENVLLTLTNVVGATVSGAQAQITIADDDFVVPPPLFQTTDFLDGPRAAVQPGPLNQDSVVQIWLDRTGSNPGEQSEVFFRRSATTSMAGLGFSSATMPDLDFSATGELLLVTTNQLGGIHLHCLNVDTDPHKSCGEVTVSEAPEIPSQLRLSASRDGTIAIGWVRSGHAHLRLFNSDLTARTTAFDLGDAAAVEVATDDMGTVAVGWLDDVLGTASVQVMNDQATVLTADPVPASASADVTSIALGFNATGVLHVATTEATGAVGAPVQLRSFDRQLNTVEATQEFGFQASAVQLAVNRGGDLILTFNDSDQAQLVLLANGQQPALLSAFDGAALAPVLTDADVVHFTVTKPTFPPSAATRFEVFEFDFALASGLCGGPGANDTELCLNNERFEVAVQWQDFEGNVGGGVAVPLTNDSGYLWFFNEANVEVVLKVLDACDFTSGYWVFATGLTDTEVLMTVDDSVAGITRSYFNQLNAPFQPILELNSFTTCEALTDLVSGGSESIESRRVQEHLTAAPSERESVWTGTGSPRVGSVQPLWTTTAATHPSQPCVPGPEVLCLNDGRFQVEIDWATTQGTNGRGQATPLTTDTGTFTFFNPDNVEIVIKLIDACDFNQRFWVFAGGLTDVETTMTVTDTEAGVELTYHNPQGQAFIPILGTDAFATCDAEH